MAVLVLLPIVLFVVPALAGHPTITGDNLLQNFPLRVLTGRQLREGHLPLWNPYVWSGSPLLGGLNAGSFYPFTFFFVFLAPVAAFVVNLLGVYWAGGLGMYALLRQYRLGPLASVLGALTYSLAGTMSGQIVHLGVVQGMGWMPLLVLAELRLSWAVLGTGPAAGRGPTSSASASPASPASSSSPASPASSSSPARPASSSSPARPASSSSPWPWVALLALMVGLEALTGEPRAMAETEVVGAAIGAWLLLRPYAASHAAAGSDVASVDVARRLRLFGWFVLAGVWGVALAAAQLAPGWTFIQVSQRSVETYQFFGTGSLPPAWSLLLLVPDLFGGAGHFGSPYYFNHYNLPEVTGYVGLLPVGAALALLARSFGRRRSARASDWGMWLALGGFGLLLAWGSFTPLGHLWAAIPLFGKTRLQSRNLEIVDLALAVLFAFWADRALAARTTPARRERAGSTSGWSTGWRRIDWRAGLVAAPAVAALVVGALALAAPGPVEEWLRVSATGAHLVRRMWPWFLAEGLVAVAVVALVLRWARLGRVARGRALVGVVAADLAIFLLVTTPAAPGAATIEPTRASAASVLGTHGRFAILDTTAEHLNTLSQIGQPDLNAFTRLASVQGYGSIVAERYADATGSHALDTLSPCALASGAFATLRLSTLLASADDLVSAEPGAGPPATVPPPAPRPARSAAAATASCTDRHLPGSTHRRSFYFGSPKTLRAATLVATGAAARAHPPKVGVVALDGRTSWPQAQVRPAPFGWRVTFRRPVTAAGLVVEGAAREISSTSTVGGTTGGRWALDGVYQDAVDTSVWRYVGTFDDWVGVFRRTTRVRPAVWLMGHSAGSSVRELAAPDWGGATDRVVARGRVTVVWSEAYMPGWHASIAPAKGSGAGAARAGSPTALPVGRHGLIQEVSVPPGRWILTFQYRPRLLTVGFVGSAVGAAGFVALLGVTVARRRRSRRVASGAPALDGRAPRRPRQEPVA